MSGLTYRKEFQGTTQLTDRSTSYFLDLRHLCFDTTSCLVWNRIRPLLEPEIAARKAKRLEEEFAKIQRNRRGIVDDLYKSYKASLHPSQWKYLPRTFDLCQLSPIAAMVEDRRTLPRTITVYTFRVTGTIAVMRRRTVLVTLTHPDLRQVGRRLLVCVELDSRLCRRL